ncbi:MAG: periplasmic heavy metal sensor [Candidatus Aminicenantes bacterium]|nr:periplasmic heavy metal sensor [Candidatus Aminicenantes bacterium]
MKKKIVMFFLIFSLWGVIWSFPQDQPQSGMQRNIRENIFTLRALRMTQALDLTQEQTAIIFPELNKSEKEKAELQQQLAGEIRELRLLIRENKAKADEFEARVNRIKELRKKIALREEAFEEFLFNQLTPVQRAKYIIFNIDFNRGLMERMHRAGLRGQKNK